MVGALLIVFIGPGLYRAEPLLFGPAHVVLLVAVLVVAPLLLDIVAPAGTDGRTPLLHRATQLIWPLAAISTAVSFLFPPGRTAGILAAPWLLFGVLTAACGVLRFYLRKGARLRIAELCIDIGLVYLFFAARWLWLARAGIKVPRVSELIVVLTAIHFHYTFFAATALTGLLGRSLTMHAAITTQRIYTAAALGVLVGPLLVATGINTSRPMMEVAGAVLLATSLFGIALLTALRGLPRSADATPRRLLQLASCAIAAAMVLAICFAVGKFYGLAPLSFPEMIRFHGISNTLYTVLSLAAWHLARRGIAPAAKSSQEDGDRLR